jgi:hypothetical protein
VRSSEPEDAPEEIELELESELKRDPGESGALSEPSEEIEDSLSVCGRVTKLVSGSSTNLARQTKRRAESFPAICL